MENDTEYDVIEVHGRTLPDLADQCYITLTEKAKQGFRLVSTTSHENDTFYFALLFMVKNG